MPRNLLDILETIPYPGYSRSLVSFGLVKSATLENRLASVRISLTTADKNIPKQIEEKVRKALQALPEVDEVKVHIDLSAPAQKAGKPPAIEAIKNVARIIGVASGKGGVGKSTVAANLACALAQQLPSNHVALMDCDFYGPSIPTLLGLTDEVLIDEHQHLQPLENHGVKAMSMGLLVDEDMPIVWRGPMVGKAIRQFAHQVCWGHTEIMIIDLPPGTGDVQLSLAQSLPLYGVVIVTTPQSSAAAVAQRGARLFGKVQVPLLGVIENMSGHAGEASLFGQGGGLTTASRLDIPLLGQIPLEISIRQGGDIGVPVVIGAPQSPPALAFKALAKKLLPTP